MQLFIFNHEEPVKVNCCNNPASTTYWMAESREQAQQEIQEKAEKREPHGLCAECIADLLATQDYRIRRRDNHTAEKMWEDNSEIRQTEEHELIINESGSRKLRVGSDGSNQTIKFSPEIFVDAECSCGEEFQSENAAYEHLEETK